MDIGAILLLLALLILVGLYISQPLMRRRSTPASIQSSKLNHDLSMLLAEKERILEALEELDNDHELGKIPEEDYPLQRGGMIKRGADILRQLDNLQIQPVSGKRDAHIEEVIAARRTSSGQHLKTQTAEGEHGDGANESLSEQFVIENAGIDDDLEIRIASRRRTRESKSGGFCPQCGNPLRTSDHFCPKCGKSLA
jgi:hypothetical protein